ncbi:putative UDP-glucuronate 4-epimerase [Helianthus annuus]|uniref:Putative NAD(P)-binding domain-containing protein n=1 Tax=Helianthus annuus TaxID=4232 RepID=A0A251T0R8_HELAN|nr:putative UDP-glucuronate 4-epimerase [Helianthus annuus]
MGVTVKSSVNIGLKTGYSVLVTVAAGFVGIHISAALRCRGDYVLGLDNFNSYYNPTLKRARQHVWKKSGIFIVEGDIKDTGLLNKLFEVLYRLLKRVQEVVGRKKGVAEFRIFDLGNTSPVPVSELVSILEKLLKVKAIRRVMKLPRIGDVTFTHAIISLA